MRKWFLISLATLAGAAAWSALVLLSAVYGWFREPLARAGDSRAFMHAAIEHIDTRNRGNVALVLLEAGRIFDRHGASVGEPVDGDTLFQVASLSKWITAWGVMALVDEGRLDLDAPVSTYLTRWQLPESEFDNDGVTVRRLLSHTAGLTDGLGFAGRVPGTVMPSLEEELAHPDASPGHDGRVRVGREPGSRFEYSGGGYLLLQLLVEEVTGETFASYMQRAVFEPLGMSRSSYAQDRRDTANVAASYEADGSPAVLYDFTAVSAAGLYTSTNDMARFLEAHLPGPNGEQVGRGVLEPETLKLMRRPMAASLGIDIWGLGAMLFVALDDGEFVIGHAGDNEPAINTMAMLNPVSGDGIVVLETGNPGMAATLAGEWVFWKTGKLDFISAAMAVYSSTPIILAGWLVIGGAGLVSAWRWRAARGAAP
jgi:CubicO group peptidase (beta-lactamase class C family)